MPFSRLDCERGRCRMPGWQGFERHGRKRRGWIRREFFLGSEVRKGERSVLADQVEKTRNCQER